MILINNNKLYFFRKYSLGFYIDTLKVKPYTSAIKNSIPKPLDVIKPLFLSTGDTSRHRKLTMRRIGNSPNFYAVYLKRYPSIHFP
jgi:hypothetical protein